MGQLSQPAQAVESIFSAWGRGLLPEPQEHGRSGPDRRHKLLYVGHEGWCPGGGGPRERILMHPGHILRHPGALLWHQGVF